MQVGAVEDAHDLGEFGLAAGELHGDAAAAVAPHLAEARQQLGEPVAALGLARRHLDARAADLRLEPARGPLGDDPAVVDDPDPVGQGVGLLEVLGGEEHGHALVVGQPRDLLPERAAALRVQAGGRLVQEQDPGRVHERQRQVEPALHSARVAADATVGRLGQPDALEQRLGAPPSLGGRQSLQRGLEHGDARGR